MYAYWVFTEDEDEDEDEDYFGRIESRESRESRESIENVFVSNADESIIVNSKCKQRMRKE